MSAAYAEEPGVEHCNEVHLVGRMAAEAFERVLPSGDTLLSWRVIVDRPPADRASTRASVDVVDCSATKAGVRRSVGGWSPGDIVEIDGALRRRFWKAAGGGPASRYEVEAKAVRRLARA